MEIVEWYGKRVVLVAPVIKDGICNCCALSYECHRLGKQQVSTGALNAYDAFRFRVNRHKCGKDYFVLESDPPEYFASKITSAGR